MIVALALAATLGHGQEQPRTAEATALPRPDTLEELLEQVRDLRATEQRINREREQAFLAARDRQRELLEEARAMLAAEERRADELRETFDANENLLAELETTLAQRMGTMGEMFGAVRQVSGDARGVFDASLVSAQIPGRSPFVAGLAESQRLPAISQLERLWFELLREMRETGRVATFPAEVVSPAGGIYRTDVTRVGVFNAVADGKFLRYLPESGQLFELTRQPAARYRSLARDLQRAEAGFAPMALDPSRGAILGLIVQTPSLIERIRQGGLVGYIILLVIMPIGLLICLERFIFLGLVGRRMQRQLRSAEPAADNPLGRIMQVYLANRNDDVETLELRLDEAILKDTPKLERGLGAIKILAAVAPLLGLLGTVIGMIITFQAITLFGTGDPKLMAGGISQALVTTVLGLATAIPLVLLHSILSGKSDRLVQILDEQSAGYVAEIAERKGQTA
ncbi:MAG: MotA/TolQ/ExbB proton channel family protein [Puniceicoccaceae bacterium]|nr:MAG: MotA/TolQ/ExbB proton channel family protein [Puniceicoccaceae bacterium]